MARAKFANIAGQMLTMCKAPKFAATYWLSRIANNFEYSIIAQVLYITCAIILQLMKSCSKFFYSDHGCYIVLMCVINFNVLS